MLLCTHPPEKHHLPLMCQHGITLDLVQIRVGIGMHVNLNTLEPDCCTCFLQPLRNGRTPDRGPRGIPHDSSRVSVLEELAPRALVCHACRKNPNQLAKHRVTPSSAPNSATSTTFSSFALEPHATRFCKKCVQAASKSSPHPD